MSGWQRRRASLDHWLHEGFGNEDSPVFHRVNTVIVLLIFVSIVEVTLGSVPWLYAQYQFWFDLSEVVVVTLFTIEYAINIYVAQDRRGYVFGIWGLIDLLAILPSILLLFDLRALKVARVLRVMRFLRLMRILRVLKLAKVATRQFDKSREQRLNTLKLDLQIYFIAFFSVLVIASTLEFYAEEFVPNTAFTSIPATMWWCIVTITTTGYGDMAPTTVLGRFVAAGTMLSGLALFALLMNVVGKAMLSSLFGAADLDKHDEVLRRGEEILNRRRRRTDLPLPGHVAVAGASSSCACGQALQPDWKLCPHCGQPALVAPAHDARPAAVQADGTGSPLLERPD